MVVLEGRTCTHCQEFKSWKAFGKAIRGLNGRRAVCKECRRLERFNRDYQQEYQRGKERIKKTVKKWREENPDKHSKQRQKEVLVKYGLSLEDYQNLKRAQDCKCAICRKTPKNHNLAIDHCHNTGKIRGLLCRTCNSAIGFLKDDPILVRRALDYLKEIEE